MEKKDIITILIAAMALLLSIISFAVGEIREKNRKDIAEIKVLYQSFTLGQKYSVPFLIYIQATVGTKEEIAKSKKDALFDLKVVQGLADYMDLRIELVEYVKNYNIKNDRNTIFSKKPVQNITDRIDAIYGQKAAASFRLGFWMPWLFLNATISSEKKYEQGIKESMQKGYGVVVDQINIDLKVLDIDERLDWKSNNIRELPKITKELNGKIKTILSERIK